MRRVIFHLAMMVLTVGNAVVNATNETARPFSLFLCPFVAGMWVAIFLNSLLEYEGERFRSKSRPARLKNYDD